MGVKESRDRGTGTGDERGRRKRGQAVKDKGGEAAMCNSVLSNNPLTSGVTCWQK